MKSKWWFKSSLPLASVGCASLLTFALLRTVGPGPWIGHSYLFAIMAAAWWGGYVAGIAACFISFFLAPYIFIPKFSPAYTDLNRLGLTMLVGLLVSRTAAVQRRSQELLKAANKTLEQRVRLRTAELERSNAELERYAYAASHDLQEPLRMIRLYAQMLARRYHGKLDPDADDYILMITTASQRMFDLVNDLLAYSKVISDPEQHVEPVRCEEAVSQAMEGCATSIAQTSAVVTCDPLPEMMANKQQLVALFQNLIGNAVAYRREAVPPVIHISATRGEREWEFSVSDNGIGLDMRFAELIFQPFKRLHGAAIPGTGLGLAICRRVVERHGGRISVESQPGQGATFKFTLPLTREQSASVREVAGGSGA